MKDTILMNRLSSWIKKNTIVKRECLQCGEVFWGNNLKTFCTRKCKEKYNERKKTITRRQKIKTNRRDDDISLAKVYKKANGICYLCGCACDYTDTRRNGKYVIVGKRYPTIDHIKPIAKGGTDTWDNVALACKQCNSIKGANPVQKIPPISS